MATCLRRNQPFRFAKVRRQWRFIRLGIPGVRAGERVFKTNVIPSFQRHKIKSLPDDPSHPVGAGDRA
jgi:hypothetical protein